MSRHVISNERPQASSSILHVETKYIPISNEKASYNCFIATYENSVTFPCIKSAGDIKITKSHINVLISIGDPDLPVDQNQPKNKYNV